MINKSAQKRYPFRNRRTKKLFDENSSSSFESERKNITCKYVVL